MILTQALMSVRDTKVYILIEFIGGIDSVWPPTIFNLRVRDTQAQAASRGWGGAGKVHS